MRPTEAETAKLKAMPAVISWLSSIMGGWRVRFFRNIVGGSSVCFVSRWFASQYCQYFSEDSVERVLVHMIDIREAMKIIRIRGLSIAVPSFRNASDSEKGHRQKRPSDYSRDLNRLVRQV